jgi:ABC-2 type transport system ATP-binding protein
LPGDVELWPNLSGGEAIDVLGRLRGSLDRARRDDLIERFKLDPSTKGRTYSKGNRQKVAIVAALASDAELMVLDEPTAGLDPLMEVVFQDVVSQLKAEGRCVSRGRASSGTLNLHRRPGSPPRGDVTAPRRRPSPG